MSKKILFSILGLFLLLNACHLASIKPHMAKLIWKTGKTNILIFLDTECPISQQMTLYIGPLRARYDTSQLALTLIFQDKATNVQIYHFLSTYQLYLPYYINTANRLSQLTGANITPEVFLYDTQKKLRYHGAINNLYADIGTKYPEPTSHFLQANTDSLLIGKPLPFVHQKAIGCFIEH